MNEIRNVTLSFPCQEEWQKLEVVPGGRLCGSCQHIVRDFRDCSMTELNEAMKSEQHVCGVFRKDQLSPSFLRVAAITLAMTATSCENEVPSPSIDKNQLTSIESTIPIEDQMIIEEMITLGIVVEVPHDSIQIDSIQTLK